jgi:hypothetical protein
VWLGHDRMKRVVMVLADFELFGGLSCSVVDYVISFLRLPSSYRSLYSYLGYYLTILYCATILDILIFTCFSFSYYY